MNGLVSAARSSISVIGFKNLCLNLSDLEIFLGLGNPPFDPPLPSPQSHRPPWTQLSVLALLLSLIEASRIPNLPPPPPSPGWVHDIAATTSC